MPKKKELTTFQVLGRTMAMAVAGWEHEMFSEPEWSPEHIVALGDEVLAPILENWSEQAEKAKNAGNGEAQ